LLGPLIGTGMLIAQQNLLSLGGDWNKIILGAVLTIVLIFWPAGLVGLLRRFRRNTA
jgi:branched-chain amino acid transport system permease protein